MRVCVRECAREGNLLVDVVLERARERAQERVWVSVQECAYESVMHFRAWLCSLRLYMPPAREPG